MNPTEILHKHDLPVDGLEPLPGGTVNRTWRTPDHVLRVSPGADHPREARPALAALAAGVRTARPVAWGAGYSIWVRLSGRSVHEFGVPAAGTWFALLDDLERLHAHLPEPRPPTPRVWIGKAHLIERTQEQARWTPTERKALKRVLASEHPIRQPVFVHGDAFGRNVLVDGAGAYVALIDWGCAGWGSLESECARLEDDALDLARHRWSTRLDVSLVMRMRLNLLLEVAALGRLSFDSVRSALEQVPRYS